MNLSPTTRRVNSIGSHLGHYPVNPYTSPWSPKGQGHSHEWPTHIPFVQCQSALPLLIYGFFKIWHWKKKKWSRPCMWSKILTLKLKFKVMAEVKPDGHIWGLELNWYTCLSFHGNHTFFDGYKANSISHLENSRSRAAQKSTKI